MLKQVLHKIGSILLAFIVLFSSFSFTLHEHICGGETADSSFFIEADSCGMDDMELCENGSTEQQVKQEPCCDDHSEIIQGNSNNQQAQQALEIPQAQFLAAFVISYNNLFESVATKTILYRDYAPPLVVKTIYKLDETYLI